MTRAYWSANGQFVIIQFQDAYSDELLSEYTKLLSSFYNTDVNEEHFLRKEMSSTVKWTSIPIYDPAGNQISPATYLAKIKAAPRFAHIKFISDLEMITPKGTQGAAYCTLKATFKDTPNGAVI